MTEELLSLRLAPYMRIPLRPALAVSGAGLQLTGRHERQDHFGRHSKPNRTAGSR